jgi:hypothetical protein
LNDGAMLDNVLRQFHSRHRGMRKAVISANGALTLQVARSLKRVGLIWGSDIGLLGFDELEWAELAGVGITTLKQPTGRLASPRSSRWCVGLKAQRPHLRAGLFRRADRQRHLPLTILRDGDHKLDILAFSLEPIPSSVINNASDYRREYWDGQKNYCRYRRVWE